jgi:subtilisin family serine protease
MRRALLAWVLAGCAAVVPESRPVGEPKQLQPGQIIVALTADRPERLPGIRKALANEYGLVEVGNFPLDSVQLECVVFQVVGDTPLPELIERLNGDPRVALAQGNQVFRELSSRDGSLSYGASLIHADAAQRTKTGKGITVAVIDTGVSTEHPGLRGRIVESHNFVEGGEQTFERDLHGTAVAGVIAAQRDDRVGMLGIAPDAGILALKACWYSAADAKAVCSSWTLAKAVDFAIKAGAQVLNLSLSGPPDALLERLIEKAQQRGMVVVAAAAESADAPGFPASMAQVIAVVASDSRGAVQLPAWTDRTFVMVAPGVDVLTTVPASGYDFLSGSSFAAAHVSGVVALLREVDPQLDARAALDLLKSTARAPPGAGPDIARHAGLVDACAALGRLLGSATCP